MGEDAPLLQIQSVQEHAAKLKVLAPTVGLQIWPWRKAQPSNGVKFSMKKLRLMEDMVDERVTQTLETLRIRFSSAGKEADLADWIRLVCLPCCTSSKHASWRLGNWQVIFRMAFPSWYIIRWYVYDTITHLTYGKPAGMVEQGRDVQNLIKSWHDMFHLGGLVATLPWLIHPIICSPVLKNYLMPQKGQSRGSGYVMSVSSK